MPFSASLLPALFTLVALAMPMAISSWREDRYSGILADAAGGLARYSHTGAHSDPDDANIFSTPIDPSRCKKVSAPVIALASIISPFRQFAATPT